MDLLKTGKTGSILSSILKHNWFWTVQYEIFIKVLLSVSKCEFWGLLKRQQIKVNKNNIQTCTTSGNKSIVSMRQMWSNSGIHPTKAGALEGVYFSYEIASLQVNQQKYALTSPHQGLRFPFLAQKQSKNYFLTAVFSN